MEEGSLAKITYQTAEDNGWPGLGREVREICKEIEIPDINIYSMRKCDIQKAISNSHYKDMMAQFEGSRKLQDIRHSDFTKLQEYFNDTDLENARMKFKIRTKMLDKIPGNFKNRYKENENGLKCDFCIDDLTQNHCVICPERIIMREGLDMTNLDDLVIYFKDILSDLRKTT